MDVHAYLRPIRRALSDPWRDTAPVRQELFGVERLEQHAASLAAAQPITLKPKSVTSLRLRLKDNAAVLLRAYRASAAELDQGRSIVPAAEWLLDDFPLVDEQIREIRADLPPGFYRQLPKLAEGPFAGYPRVFGIAWAFVAHTDSYFNPDTLRRFIAAYQTVQPLTIGELWAVAITLRIVLVENLRRLVDQMTLGRAKRAEADAFADGLLAVGHARSALELDISARSMGPLSEIFSAQLAKRLRDLDPRTTPALGWLEERLRLQGVSVEDVVRHALQRQGASNVSVRNVMTSMRLISAIDWAELFESVSLVDERLRSASGFAAMDFPTRNLYRSAIEQLSRGSSLSEIAVAECALDAAKAEPDPAAHAADPGYHLIARGRRALERTIGFRAPARLLIGRFNVRLGIGGYVGLIVLVSACLLALAMSALTGAGWAWLTIIGFLGFLPATEVATALVNRAITSSFGPGLLPGLALASGVPSSLRTLVVMPTLLTGEADLIEHIQRLEVHFLSGAGGDLAFALLTDGVDADTEDLETDAPLLAIGAKAIADLNALNGPGPEGDRFFLLHRRRRFNAGEG